MGCNQSKAADDDYPPGNPPYANTNSDRKSKALDVEDEKASVGCDEDFPFIDDEKDKDKEKEKEKEEGVGNGSADDFKPLPPLVLKEEKTESETMQVTKEREDNIEHERVVIQKQVKTVREEVHMVRLVDGEEVCDTINEGTEEYRESGKEVLVIQEKMTKEELEEELRKMGQDVNLDEEAAKEEKKEEEHSEPPKEEVVSETTTTVVESEPVVSETTTTIVESAPVSRTEEKTEVLDDGTERTVVTTTTTSTVEVVNGVQQEEVTNVSRTTVVESTPPVAEDQVKVEVTEEIPNDISNEVEVEVQGLPDPEPLEEEELVEHEESIRGTADDGFLRWDAKPSEPEISYNLPGGTGEVIIVGSEQVPNIESSVTVTEEIEVEGAPGQVESVPQYVAELEDKTVDEPEPVVEKPEPEPVKEEESEHVVVEEEQPEQVQDEKPEPVQEDKPEPVQEEVSEPVQEEQPEPEPVREESPEPVKEELPEPVPEEQPEPVQEEETKTETVVETHSEVVQEVEVKEVEPVQSEPSDHSDHENNKSSDHEDDKSSDHSDHEDDKSSDHSDREDQVVVEESHTVEAGHSLEEPSDKLPTSGDGFLNWNATPSEPEIVYRVPGGEGEIVVVGTDENHVESNGVNDDEIQVKTVDDVLKSAEDQEQEVSD